MIYLIRHAETVGNIEERLTGRKDYALTLKGYKVAQKLKKFFENQKIDGIYCSTSNRTIATIQKVAESKQIDISTNSELCEMYFGIYDGWKWEDVNRENPRINQLHMQTNQIMQIPQQESTNQVQQRMIKVMQDIANKNIEKNIIVVSHGVAIEAFLRWISKEKFENKREEYSQHNGSINILSYDEKIRKFQIIKLNDVSYQEEQ